MVVGVVGGVRVYEVGRVFEVGGSAFAPFTTAPPRLAGLPRGGRRGSGLRGRRRGRRIKGRGNRRRRRRRRSLFRGELAGCYLLCFPFLFLAGGRLLICSAYGLRLQVLLVEPRLHFRLVLLLSNEPLVSLTSSTGKDSPFLPPLSTLQLRPLQQHPLRSTFRLTFMATF